MKRRSAFAAVVLCHLAAAMPAAAETETETLNRFARAVCAGWQGELADALAPFGAVAGDERRGRPGGPGQRRIVVATPGGARLEAQVAAANGMLRRLRAERADPAPGGGLRPTVLVDLGPDCTPTLGRRIDYDREGRAERLVHLGPDLAETGETEPLNPPIPAGRDPGGVTVAHVDSGVNYLLDFIAARLARDGDGKPLGRDFRDGDDRPFDIETARSPFFPLRHGTAVASILVREAPAARLLPYRYPRQDLGLMAEVVDRAAADGARIVMMPLGSRDEADWRAFAGAARRQPDILFVVSAGNDGRDIDVAPVFPAALDLPNMVVVTSADAFGRLAEGSNWGRRSVDLMVPGEGIEVVDHRGAEGRASGSSFAVPRVAALAARLAAAHPEWKAAELAAALKSRARPPLERGDQRVGWGWIANPLDDR